MWKASLLLITLLSNSCCQALQMSGSGGWSALKQRSNECSVGKALTEDSELRSKGRGSPHVSNTLRLFDAPDDYQPKLTLFRDEAGWCPYCEKTILMVEEKRVPINIQVVPMRSYGDKPREFMAMVPNGLLPALTIDMPDGKKQVITESQVIMEIIDKLHPPSDGYLPMMPESDDLLRKHQELAKLERELFSWWCNLIFRPETGGGEGMASLMGSLMGGGSDMSGSMRGFLDCLERVDSALRSTSGPWFLGSEHPMMIDFIFVSHIERMLASCAYWKGLQIRGAGKWKGIDAWFDAFDQRPSYLAFKSDFYTNIMDIPPQYGFCYDGGFDDKREKFQSILLGRDGKSWTLPLAHDAIPLEPLYQGPPLPQNVLEAVSLTDYKNSDPMIMAKVCRQAAGWKLASNGINVSRFAARGGSRGGKNARKSFQAPLADPYADPDDVARPSVDKVLQIVCEALLDESDDHDTTLANLTPVLKDAVDSDVNDDVASSLAYLRDRVGVPRDMPLAAARHFRAHLNWAIDAISS